MPLTPLDWFLDGSADGKTEKDKEGRKVIDAGKPFTLWSFENKQKWFLDGDEMDTFYRLYFQDIENTVPRYFTEKCTPVGQLRVDLDFKYDGRVAAHKHTQEHVKSFVQAYMAEVGKYLETPDDVEIYVLEKDYPTFDPIKKVSSSGIHLQVPGLKTRAGVEQSIRRTLLKRMDEFFPDLGCNKGWEDVYDKSPLSHTNNWPLLGSKKPDGLPYKIRYILDWDKESGEVSVDTTIPKLTVDLIRTLSVRSTPADETTMTEYGKQNIHHAPEREIASGVERAVAAPRGRPTSRDTMDGSRGSSPGRILIPPLTQELRDYYEGHVKNLRSFRYTEYAEWISVGQCLKNLHPDLNDVWHEFSAKGDGYKFQEAEQKWNSFGYRVDGVKLGLGSLRHWSREDNPEGYKKVEDENINALMERSTETATENDVARVIHAKYRDEFKCAKFGQNIWYRYKDHIWCETDRGVALQIRLSKDVSDMYLDKELSETTKLRNLSRCEHKDPDPSCDCCKAEQAKKSYSNIRLKLKRTGFKESVMKECRELFLDEQLALKLDENKNLIAFENGVFDCSTMEFRDGKPEDYISFSTKITYDPEKHYSTYECWAELDKFLRSILPNENVRRYFLKHLSTCLSGGNEAQKFHILTGSGSNGKSMLMNLMATAFGDYCCKAPISLLTQQRNKSAAAAPELVRMKGRRFVTMQEPDEQVPLNTGLMKELASCEKITARDLYAGSKQMIDFDIQARFHLACNEKPKVNSTDGGTWRRLVVIDFPMKFVAEPRLPNELPIDETIVQKVVSEEWATCFMNYLIAVYKDGRGWRKLTPPVEVMAYTNEYKEESDVIARFIREYFHPVDVTGDPEASSPEPVTWQSITATFQEWKRSNEVANRGNIQELKKRVEAEFGKYPRNGWISFRFGNA
jgi:P4 family phage/plasmid primase-like protien